MYRDATACFFIALEKNNWICCLDTGRMMGLVVGGWRSPQPHDTTAKTKLSACSDSQPIRVAFIFLSKTVREAHFPSRENQHSSRGSRPGDGGGSGGF